MKRVFALFLCLLVLFCSCSVPVHTPPVRTESSVNSETEEIRRSYVAFEDMAYERPDTEQLLERLQGLYDQFFLEKSRSGQESLLTEANRLQMEFMTMYALADIRSAMDTQDAFYQQEIQLMEKGRISIAQVTAAFYNRLLSPENSDLAQEFTSPWEQEEMQQMVRSYSQDTLSLLDQEDALCRQYAKELAAAETASSAQEFCQQYYSSWSEIFLSLCQVRQDLAQKLGYESFVGLAYDRMGRTDYGPQQVEEFRNQVKEKLVPAYQKLIQQTAKDAGLEKLPFYAFPYMAPVPEWESSTENTLALFQDVYREMSPSTGECMDYLLEYHLYDLEPRENKSPGGFQEYIYGYASPFLFGTFQGGSEDISLFSHEFGHFYAAFEKINPDPDCYQEGDRTMDIKEMQSSGMEVLTMRWYPAFYGDAAPAFEKAAVLEMFTLVLDCCLYDQWQHEIYQEWDSISASSDPAGECDRRMARLRQEYYGDLDYTLLEPYGQGKMWIEKSHVFETPFYMIDYALAYSVALQLYALSLEDWDAAFSAYQALVRQPSGSSFLDVVEAAGLESPFSSEAMEILAELWGKVIE